MDNRTANPAGPPTLLDELAFAKGSTFEIVGSVIRADKATGRGWEIGSLMSVLEYGERLGRDLSAEAKHLAETAPSEEEILRRYFRVVCAGKNPRKTFRRPGGLEPTCLKASFPKTGVFALSPVSSLVVDRV